jgi:hypothetical protein
LSIVRLSLREARLRRTIRAHLRELGFSRSEDGALLPPSLDKDAYRSFHRSQRADRSARDAAFLVGRGTALLSHFASGDDIDPARIQPRVEQIRQGTWQSDLFRLASNSWSVPVSMGFGRRLRFLVWDDHCNKLIGLFALGDPVFNLRVRDQLVGWTSKQREERLINVLDAYVVGAVPPYSMLLGGKLVACLIRTQEVVDAFRDRYWNTRGLISGRANRPSLLLATTTSALGRSSLYNRLKLEGDTYFRSIGFTSGWGHFHFPDSIFADMRAYLRSRRDEYANNHRFGDGPNWRMRCIRKTLDLLDMDPDLVRHGFQREVFVSEIADNAMEVLQGKRKRPRYDRLLSANSVSHLAVNRWLRPRAERDDRFRAWTPEHTVQLLGVSVSAAPRSTVQTSHARRKRAT